jgi:hypothetical protein
LVFALIIHNLIAAKEKLEIVLSVRLRRIWDFSRGAFLAPPWRGENGSHHFKNTGQKLCFWTPGTSQILVV